MYPRAFVTASGPEREPKTLYYIAVCDFNYKVKPFAVGIGARRRRATGPVIKTVRGPFVPVYLQITRYLGVHVFAINQPPGLLQRSLDGLVFNNRIKTTPSGPGARALSHTALSAARVPYYLPHAVPVTFPRESPPLLRPLLRRIYVTAIISASHLATSCERASSAPPVRVR